MYTEISALELPGIIQSKQDIEIIDVREQKEWDMVRLPHAKLIPLSQIQTRSHEIDFGKDVYILCRS
jgi:adenylyltransferase/sulfurtransferase